MVSSDARWPAPAEAPAEEDLSRCVHCGLCLTSCPTYQVTGQEMESPRGRIYLARSVAEGTLLKTGAIEAHWDLCLQCRACETACPSGVPYGRIMEHVRAQVAAGPDSKKPQRWMRRWFLRNVIARPLVLRSVFAPARWLAARLSPAFKASLRPGSLRRLAAQLPAGQGEPVRAGFRSAPKSPASGKVSLLTGCVMGELFGEVHRATARLLNRRGIDVVAPAGQVCCGALHAHDGDLEYARGLARKNIEAFEESGPGPIIVNSAGCGAAMKEYGDLLADDPEWATPAKRFAARVKDLSEFLVELGEDRPARLQATVTYQDACHLVHAQGIREQPRALLGAIDDCELVETAGADRCCGAAGFYSINQPRMSGELRRRKALEIGASGARIVVTANPGCQMQYLAGCAEARIDAEVLHLAEVLDRAESAAEPAR